MKRYTYYLFASLLAFSALIGCSRDNKRPPANFTEASPAGNVTTFSDSLVAQSDESSFAKPIGKVVGGKRVGRTCPATIVADNVTLLIDSGAVSHDVQISIVATTEENSGEIPANMANLTADGAVYRMLPDGQRFEKDISIAMRYDSTALPYGYTADDIYTFFYNEQTRMWQQVERDSVDTQNQIVYSRTNHFTDYINGVLKVPESSDAMAYTPTSIKDLKAADPMEGITLIAPPEANNQGTANLSYPLNIPAGRHGMQPHLSINYNSAGGSGILGLGWSLPISEISVETRWGVPLYDSNKETEAYLLDGTALVTAYEDEHNNLRLNKPVYHRNYEPRNSNDTTRFYPRVEGAFRKIERIGTHPSNYHWIVTDKDGTRHYYGFSEQSTLRDHKRNIAKWMLEKSIDTYGNTVIYNYTTKYVSVPGQPSGKQLCINHIYYTGENNSRGLYTIRFGYVDKHDKTNSFRYGLEEINNYLLDRIEVMFCDNIIREYYFGYTEGEFGKTLLCKIFEGYDDEQRNQLYAVDTTYNTIRAFSAYERCNAEMIKLLGEQGFLLHIFHSFEYYGLDTSIATGSIFGEAETIHHQGDIDHSLFNHYNTTLNENRNIGGSGSVGWNVYGGLNVGCDYIPYLKTVSAGGHYSYGEDYSEGFLQLVDINGDGYPDKLYKSIFDNVLRCRPQLPGSNTFGAPVSISGVNSFLYTESSTENYGWEASALSLIGTGKSWSDGRSNTYTYVSDVNGDGLIDIVDNGSVFINRGNYRFDNVTNNDTIHVGGTCEGEVIDFSGEVDPTMFDDGDYTYDSVVCINKIQIVPVWDTRYDSVKNYFEEYVSHYDTIPYDSCYTITVTASYVYPRRYEPQVDLVRMWKAPYDGNISITGIAKLTDDLDTFRTQTRTADGVWVSIQRAGEDSLRIQDTITPDNPHSMNCTINNIKAGDTIFFRINAVDKRLYDQVEWIPTIEYTSATHRNNENNSSLLMVDADSISVYRFNYAEDFMLAENQSVTVGPESVSSCTNKFTVSCELKSSKPLTQDARIAIYRAHINTDGTTGPEYPIPQAGQIYPKGFILNDVFSKTNLGVSGDEKLIVRLSALGGGQLNWADIKTDATVTLTYCSDVAINTRLSDTNARKSYIYHPSVQRSFYDYLVFPATPIHIPSNANQMYIKVYRGDGVVFSGNLHMTIKGTSPSVYFNNDVNFTSNGEQTISLSQIPTEYSYVDFYTDDSVLAQKISDIKVVFKRNGNALGSSVDAGLYGNFATDSWKHHGTLYRGWGQFGYQSPDGMLAYINSADIKAGAYYTDPNAAPKPNEDDINNYSQGLLDPDSTPDENPAGQNFNPLSGTFFEMHADPENHRWKSYALLVTASDSVSSLDNVDPAVEYGETPRVNMYQSPLPVVSPQAKMKAVNKFMMNKGTSRTMIEIAESNGYSRLLGDYMDMNGDRYPDNVSEKLIQYSRAQGGLSDKEIGFPESYISHTGNSSSGKAKNGTFVNMMFESMANAKKSRAISRVSGLFQLLTGDNNKTTGMDAVQSTLMDINGDGLADIVYSDNNVRYNMGYGFTAKRALQTGQIRSSKSVSGGTGYGFNVGNTSISGSVSRNESDNETLYALMDINGDGLPDKVSLNSVEFNMGDGLFTDPVTSGLSMDKGVSTSFCLNVSATYDVVFSVFGVPVKVGGSAGGGGSVTLSQSKAEFVDMNNDGFVDYVYLDNANNVKVCYSNIGRANLLKSVNNFADARYTVDYALDNATVDCPQRHWKMVKLEVYDGYNGDGESTMYKTFEYGNRHYDRYERDDYGYDMVKTYDYETQSDFNNNMVYRTTTQHFYNDGYYHNGLKIDETVSKDDKSVMTEYTYSDADIRNGYYLGATMPWCEGDGWPAIYGERTSYDEGAGNSITTERYYSYGSYGNVIQVDEYGDLNDNDDDYTVEIEYDQSPNLISKYIVSNVKSIEIPGYRQRNATYNDQGSLKSICINNAPNQTSCYEYKYDIYGNVEHVSTPALDHTNTNNYWIYYTYDPVVHMLPISVTNASGYSSSADYSYRWQKPINTIDVGGNRMHYAYDSHGRTDTIIAPKELAIGRPYTVKYDYWYTHKVNLWDNDRYFWARTHNFDPSHPGNDINTVIFSDGLGRVIQVKKDVEVNGQEVRVVGGTVHYDGLGRKVSEFFPISEAMNHPDINLNITVAATNVDSTSTAYDYLDRPVQVDYADGTQSLNEYSIATDDNGYDRFLNEVTDQNGHISKIYTDARKLNVQVTDALTHATKFYYDAVGQLWQSEDPEGNTTTHAYDLGGRRTDRDHPSAGHTHWDYDAAGNMIRQTQNSGEYIQYFYDYSRPVHIKYSDRPWNDVWYEYGSAGSGNQAGRLLRQQDATGVQSFKYDNMGNVVYNAHTYVQPHSHNTFTLETQWEYDSWGRVKTIIYPDRERVSYFYDHGGNVCHIEGSKGNLPTMNYIDTLLYDLYEQRIYQRYGNGVETWYSYDPQNRRLISLVDSSTVEGLLQNNKYTYDNVGNIDTISDSGRYIRNQYFEYDDINRLVYSYGEWNNSTLDYTAYYQYSAAGRMEYKDVYSSRTNNMNPYYVVNYNNSYSYNSNNPFAVESIGNNGNTTLFQWDANGNMTHSVCARPFYERRLCWTEDNRLQGYTEYSDENGDMSAWYNYNAGGDRNFKITSPNVNMRQNAAGLRYGAHLVFPTLYASAFVTINKGGYTKHYFEGTNRVCSKIGGGFGLVDWNGITDRVPSLAHDYNHQSYAQHESVGQTFGECLGIGVEFDGVKDLFDVMKHEAERKEKEPAFYYHSDHLGSAAYLTNDAGQVTQTLNYLPYGEDWVDIQNNLDPNLGQYTFNGKEKDYESGFHYYGARYYWCEVLTGWLSVDPMADKYPNISPYAYCSWNPVLLVDPDGEFPILPFIFAMKGAARGVEHFSQNSNVKTFAYTVNHPYNAMRIGIMKDGGKNGISSFSHNFSVEMCKAANLSRDPEGSQRNAIRHTLWQAMLTNEFGPSQAERIGDNHENGPKADLSQRTFSNMEEADVVCDQLNNAIGRSIGERNKGVSNATMAEKVATELYNNGLWTAIENSDGSVSINKTKINNAEYQKVINELKKLNNYGLHE